MKEARYHTLFHTVRAPKYAAKTVAYAPGGALRTAGRLMRWASAEDGNWGLRQHAATSNDASTWLALDARRQRQARWRWPLLVTAAVAALVAVAALATVPGLGLWRWLAAGRPGGRGGAGRASGGQADH